MNCACQEWAPRKALLALMYQRPLFLPLTTTERGDTRYGAWDMSRLDWTCPNHHGHDRVRQNLRKYTRLKHLGRGHADAHCLDHDAGYGRRAR